MRAYIEHQAESLTQGGHNVEQLLQEVSSTPYAAEVTLRFAAVVEQVSLS